MKRLTFVKCPKYWDTGRHPTPYSSRKTFQEVVARLAYYEDMEEQGRLVVLEKKEHQADVLQYYKNYRDRLERYEQALKEGAN